MKAMSACAKSRRALTTAQRDRACGVLLGTAAGDALGAPYEFQPARGPGREVAMVGGGGFGWEPGEWTDDTSMAVAIAQVAATGADLREESVQDEIVKRWYEWSRSAKDVGIQTRNVLNSAGAQGVSAANARTAAHELHQRTGRTAGNGSLMRTAPVALAYLDDEKALVDAARAVSMLTHYDPEAGDACVLWWCLAIRHAVLTGELDVRVGLRHIDAARREPWAARLDAAEASRPRDFANNGWVVAPWSAIAMTARSGGLPAEHLWVGLDAAVRAGDDTDTVAAIAGGLLGAAYGASAVPAAWRRLLHGWPGMTTRSLVALAGVIASGGASNPSYPCPETNVVARHPYDDGLWIGGIGALRALPSDVDVVVSLCRVADEEVPSAVEQVDVRLIDNDDPAENANLDFVLLDTVRLLEELRGEGRTVLLHCVQAQRRTPAVAALYGARKRGVDIEQAFDDIGAVLPGVLVNPAFRDALQRLHPGSAQ